MTLTPPWLLRSAAPQPPITSGQGVCGGKREASTAPPATPPKPKLGKDGVVEPEQCAFDGCKRREQVQDYDFWPPRVVRVVGWNLCLPCQRPFFSPDVRGDSHVPHM